MTLYDSLLAVLLFVELGAIFAMYRSARTWSVAPSMAFGSALWLSGCLRHDTWEIVAGLGVLGLMWLCEWMHRRIEATRREIEELARRRRRP